MKNNLTFYLWADAEKSIGLGHLNRIRFLSQSLVANNSNFKIVTKFNSLSKTLLKKKVFFLKKSIKFFVNHMKIPLEFKKGKGTKILFIDSYYLNKKYIEMLKLNNLKVVYFNDFKKSISADLNICLGSHTKRKNFLSGLNYIPLSKDYLKSKTNNLNKNTVLITFGALDHYNLSIKLVEILLKYKLQLIVIIGKYYNNKIYKQLLKKKSKKIKLVNQPNNLYKYLKKSDSVICAGGFTVFESLALGIPTLCLELWKNQSANLIDLKKKKLVKTISFKRQKLLKLNRSHLDVFFNKKYRNNISNRSKKIISRKGSLNILKESIRRLS